MNPDIPAYSSAALAARDIFVFQFNDILIYVEDADRENFYQNVFRRLLPNLKVENFLALKGKKNVLKHYGEASALPKPSFYLLDLDYDDLLDIRINNKNLIYLKKYSIENYLTEESSVVELIISENPTVKRGEILANIKLDDFLERSVEKMRPLIRAFFLNQKFIGGEKSCSIGIEVFTRGNPYTVDGAAVAQYEQQIFETLSKAGHFKSLEEMRACGDRYIPFGAKALLRHACGKHLLGLLRHWLAKNWNVVSMSKDTFAYRLARECEFESLRFVADTINAEMNALAA
jgi:hypothetical protein